MIITLIGMLMTGFLIFCFIMAFRSSRKSNAQATEMLKSKAFGEISNCIFSVGRPPQIYITVSNEIYYGPLNGEFYQVPAHIVPFMNHLERYSLGKALSAQYNYTFATCFGPQGQNLEICQSGNGYLDANTDIFLSGSTAAGSWN